MDEEKQKHPGGRPRFYETPEEMQDAIDKYFDEHDEPTVHGLALKLRFKHRNGLDNYEEYSKEFHSIITRAKMRIAESYESGLRDRKQARGCIFALNAMFDCAETREEKIQHELPPIQLFLNSDGPKRVQAGNEPQTD